MTANQVAYANYLETGRSNRAKEQENYRHNVATEGLTHAANQELVRHNLEVERTNRDSLAETVRRNNLDYRVRVAQATEVQRHNLASERQVDRELSDQRFFKQQENSIKRGQLAHSYYQTNTVRDTNFAEMFSKERQHREKLEFEKTRLQDQKNMWMLSEVKKTVDMLANNVMSTMSGVIKGLVSGGF